MKMEISYNGRLVKSVPKHKVGTILTRDGKVLSRSSLDERWAVIQTPISFFFYDNKTYSSYCVNTEEKYLEKKNPTGRIIDCTDQKLYEIQKEEWCPIYDFKPPKKDKNIYQTECLDSISPTGISLNCFVETCTDISEEMVAPTGNNAYMIISFCVPKTGIFTVEVSLSYLTDNSLDQTNLFDNFILVLNDNQLLSRIPVEYDYDPNVFAHYTTSSGQAILKKTLCLTEGDQLEVYLVSHFENPTGNYPQPKYRLNSAGSWLSCI